MSKASGGRWRVDGLGQDDRWSSSRGDPDAYVPGSDRDLHTGVDYNVPPSAESGGADAPTSGATAPPPDAPGQTASAPGTGTVLIGLAMAGVAAYYLLWSER